MILIDLNVVLDVVQKREPHYSASAAVMGRVTDSHISACLPAHAFTTLHYLVSRHQNETAANRVVDWLLRYFEVAGTTDRELKEHERWTGPISKTLWSQPLPNLIRARIS